MQKIWRRGRHVVRVPGPRFFYMVFYAKRICDMGWGVTRHNLSIRWPSQWLLWSRLARVSSSSRSRAAVVLAAAAPWSFLHMLQLPPTHDTTRPPLQLPHFPCAQLLDCSSINWLSTWAWPRAHQLSLPAAHLAHLFDHSNVNCCQRIRHTFAPTLDNGQNVVQDEMLR